MDFLLRRRRKRWLLFAAGSAIAIYAAKRLYHLPSVTRRREKLSRLMGTLSAIADAAAASADAVALVSSDVNLFIRSDSDEIPTSLRQVSKIARSDEFSGSVSKVTEALTTGIVRGLQSGPESNDPESVTGASFSDQFFEKLFSSDGAGFASIVAGSFARGLVKGFQAKGSEEGAESGGSWHPVLQAVPRWAQLICGDECRDMVGDCIQVFVSTAVAVYLDKTMHINFYDEMFSGLTNPKHENKMKDMLVSMCNVAVETLVKTSHKVLTSTNLSSSESSTAECFTKDQNFGLELARKSSFDHTGKDGGGGGWVSQVTSTLAVSSNRRFVLDVTGRITFETVRSFLEFVLWKLYDGTKRSADTAREELVERGLQVLRHFSSKSLVIATICIALCMHVLLGMSDLVPA